MNRNTSNLPGTGNLSDLDFHIEIMRGNSINRTKNPVHEVPEEWQDKFTVQEWNEYRNERFEAWHSYAWVLSPEDYLNGTRCAQMK